MSTLELINVGKIFEGSRGQRHVLDAVNCAVEPGEFVSIVGYSGSGKSTLLSIFCGLIECTSGEVRVDGKKLNGFASKAAIVFQNYSLLPWFSAMENVRLAVEAAFPDWSKAKQLEQSARYLDMVGLKNAHEKRPSQLSGGMRQRVAIARAFAVEPELLFLDEPFGALDALTRASLQQELGSMCASTNRKLTTVMITNSVEEAILLSDRIIPLSRGPKATLGPAIAVTLPQPRTTDLLLHSPEAAQVEARVIDYLTGFTHGTGQGKPVARTAARASMVEQEVEL